MNTTIYYHADCLDGFAAAYAAWRDLGSQARYRPIHHGALPDPNDIQGNDVFVLDYAFDRETTLQMAEQARRFTLLDHHVTARRAWADSLQPDPRGGESFRDASRHLAVHFDLQRSGASLAWQHFHPDTPLPRLLAHVEDIDLWRFALPDTRAFCRALRLEPWDFERWDQLVRDTATVDAPRHQEMVAAGQSIERFLNTEVARLADSRLLCPVTLRGEAIDPLQAVRHGIPTITENGETWRALQGTAINASSLFASELGHVLAERNHSFALIWEMTGQGVVKASLRAAGRVNVAEVAEHYGGGGHPNAAGFRLPAAEFLALLAPRP